MPPQNQQPVGQTYAPGSSNTAQAPETQTPAVPVNPGSWHRIKDRARRIAASWTIAVVAATVLAIIALGIYYLKYYRGKPAAAPDSKFSTNGVPDIPGQGTIGQPGQTLRINANSYFDGSLTANRDINVKGNFNVAGTQQVKDLQVAGSLSAAKLDLKSGLTVSSATIQGLASANDLSVTGNGSFGGTLSVATLSTRNLTVTGHYISSGTTPGVSTGSAAGSGGTASVSGNDTAGTITINVGSGAPAGVLANMSFRAAYGATPHINLTPLTSAAAGIGFYVTRTTGGFTVSAASPPAPGTYSFDYMVLQ